MIGHDLEQMVHILVCWPFLGKQEWQMGRPVVDSFGLGEAQLGHIQGTWSAWELHLELVSRALEESICCMLLSCSCEQESDFHQLGRPRLTTQGSQHVYDLVFHWSCANAWRLDVEWVYATYEILDFGLRSLIHFVGRMVSSAPLETI